MKRVEAILEHLGKTRAGLLTAAGTVPGDRWREPPASGAWSAGEVIAHLTMVEESVINRARKTVQGKPEPLPAWKRVHLPVRFTMYRRPRVKTPIPLDPTRVTAKGEAIGRLAGARDRTLAFIGEIRDRDLSRYRFPHPFLGSLNVYDWLRMIGYHEARHTKQICEIVKAFQR